VHAAVQVGVLHDLERVTVKKAVAQALGRE